ncbi:MAG: MFS transporter [Burkholderiales bacterium]
MTPARRAGVALAATLAIQVFTSLSATAVPVLAPEIAADLGVPARWVGVFVGLVYLGAMGASFVSGAWIARLGAIRVSQTCVALCAVGIAGVAASGAGALPLVVLAAVTMGLGYGPITPASSHVLARTTPAARMNLVFSIKQTGVPAGAAIAGAVLPAVALAAGWRGAFAVVAALGIVVIAAAQPIRAALDTGRRADAPATLGHALSRVRRVIADPRLAPLAWISWAYAAAQVSLTSFLVVHLTGTLGWSLIAAGLALSVATAGGVAGRILWGYVADRTRAPFAVLGTTGLVSSACAALAALATPDWPALAIYPLVAVFGATAIGWNGVQLAELARRAPEGDAGAITGAAGVITFSGVVAGPPLFGALAALTGSTRSGFAATALLAAAAAFAFAIIPAVSSRDEHSSESKH